MAQSPWRARRFVAGFMALLMGLSVLALAPGAHATDHIDPAASPDNVDVQRLAGGDRAGTAAEIALEVYGDTGSDTALIARFDLEFDALAAGYLAGCLDAPVLVTFREPVVVGGQTINVHPDTADALEELGVEDVIILGGPAAISAEVEAALAEDYNTERVFGPVREDTAAAVAQYPGCEVGEVDGESTALLARRDVSADALSGGGVAFNGQFPTLLTQTGSLHPATEAALEALEIDHVIILGGPVAVSPAVETQLEAAGYETTRLAGPGRWETAIEVAEFAVDNLGRDWSEVGLARSDVAYDAMTSAPYIGHNHRGGLLLLATTLDGNSAHPATRAKVQEQAPQIIRLTAFGGPNAISQSVLDTLTDDANTGEAPSNQSFAVGPQASQIVQLQGEPGDHFGGTAQSIQYNVGGLEPGASHRLALFPCGDDGMDAAVKVNGQRYPDRNGQSNDGEFIFRDQNLDNIADDDGWTQNGYAYIVSIGLQGFAPGTQATSFTAPADGNQTFRIGVPDDSDGDCAVPVIWRDMADGTANRLDLTTASRNSWNTPRENFGVGGTAVFHFGEAPTGTEFDDEVMFLNLAERYVVLEDGWQYFWGRAGDQYYYEGAEAEGFINQTNFELYISIGDVLDWDAGNPPTSAYARPGGNIFQIEDDTPGTPLNVTVTEVDTTNDGTLDSIRVMWDHPDPLEGNDDQGCVQGIRVDDNSFTLTHPGCTAEVNTLTPRDSLRQFTFAKDATFADGRTFLFRVDIDSETDEDGDWSLLSAPHAVGGAVPQALITDQRVTDDTTGATVGVLDDGDEIRMRFNREMMTTTNNTVFFRWSDDDSVYQVACGDQATCTWQAVGANANRQLTMLLTADPVFISGTDNGLDITGEGALMTFVSNGVRTALGGTVDLENSPDRRLNVAAALP